MSQSDRGVTTSRVGVHRECDLFGYWRERGRGQVTVPTTYLHTTWRDWACPVLCNKPSKGRFFEPSLQHTFTPHGGTHRSYVLCIETPTRRFAPPRSFVRDTRPFRPCREQASGGDNFIILFLLYWGEMSQSDRGVTTSRVEMHRECGLFG